MSNLRDEDYHFAARVVDLSGAASAWTLYGANTDGETDFRVTNLQPTLTGVGQQQVNDTAIPVGGTVDGATLEFVAQIADPELQQVNFQVEVKPLGTAFDELATAQSGMVASGSDVVITVADLDEGSYHWRGRVLDSAGAISDWTAGAGAIASTALEGTCTSWSS